MFRVTDVSQVVEMNDSEKSLDPVTRAASAMGRGRPGLTKAWSVSSPNMTNMDMEVDILERIRDLEGQIAAQQVSLTFNWLIVSIIDDIMYFWQDTIRSQQLQISEFGSVKDIGYESQSSATSSSAAGSANMANLSLNININGDMDGN